MNVIFLDIDGVLNTDRWEALCLSEDIELEDKFGITFDDISIANLRTIISRTNASIVIHSTWKLHHDVEWFVDMWNTRNLPGFIISITPNIAPDYDKHNEISMWLKLHPQISQYVILDDEKEFVSPLSEHHILIDGLCGITMSNAEKAIKLLL